MNRFALGQNVAIGIEERDDAGILPEGNREQLQPGKIRAKFADGLVLCVANSDLVFLEFIERSNQPAKQVAA